MGIRKDKNDFWKRLHFKYRLSAINENTLEEKWKIRASAFYGIVLFVVVAFVIICITSIVIIATPIRYYLPGYLDSELRSTSVKSIMRIDSLEHKLQVQNAYLLNLQKVLRGNLSIDSSTINADTLSLPKQNKLLAKSEREEEFDNEYQKTEQYNLSTLVSENQAPAKELVFYKPVKDIISCVVLKSATSVKTVKIETRFPETVTAVMDGTVFSYGYDMDGTCFLQIQHSNGFVSVYKGLTKVFKKVGDKIKTGEAVGILDKQKNTAKKTGQMLFELWYRGSSVDPNEYISF